MVIKKAVYVWVIGILGMISFAACSSASQGEVPSTSNAALDNIFARKSVRAYLDKEVEKEKIDWMLRAGMAAPSEKIFVRGSLYWSPTGLLLIRWPLLYLMQRC